MRSNVDSNEPRRYLSGGSAFYPRIRYDNLATLKVHGETARWDRRHCSKAENSNSPFTSRFVAHGYLLCAWGKWLLAHVSDFGTREVSRSCCSGSANE